MNGIILLTISPAGDTQMNSFYEHHGQHSFGIIVALTGSC